MNELKFRMVAYTGAAGKYDPDAPMCGNEDNFYVDDDLSNDITGHCDADKAIVMNDCGIIMAVCDGMGGMNAGEVASAMAVQTIQDYFSHNKISADVAKNPKERRSYLEKLVVEADKRIKDDSKRNPNHEGMGSTIILAWIVGNELTLTWCGDSRAYRYNPSSGITMLSEDHSYVQDLVKQGLLTYEDTFEHPQGNIITRSLGDPSKRAKPETREFLLYKDDIILLCSDGLSGVLRDRKTKDADGNYYPGENIEDLIGNNTSSMLQCKNALWNAAQNADWYDNVTILLCQILEGPSFPNSPKTLEHNNPNNTTDDNVAADKPSNSINTADVSDGRNGNFWNKTLHLNLKIKPHQLILSIIAIIVCIVGCWLSYKYNDNENHTVGTNALADSIITIKQDSLKGVVVAQHRFFELSGLVYDTSSVFDAVKERISAIRDSTTLLMAEECVNDLLDTIQTITKQLEYVDSQIRIVANDKNKVKALAELKQRYINGMVTASELEEQVNEVIGIKAVNKPPTEIPENNQTVELTPVLGDTISESFVMKTYPDYIGQINSLVKKFKDYTFLGIYKNDNKIESKQYKAGETYEARFTK